MAYRKKKSTRKESDVYVPYSDPLFHIGNGHLSEPDRSFPPQFQPQRQRQPRPQQHHYLQRSPEPLFAQKPDSFALPPRVLFSPFAPLPPPLPPIAVSDDIKVDLIGLANHALSEPPMGPQYLKGWSAAQKLYDWSRTTVDVPPELFSNAEEVAERIITHRVNSRRGMSIDEFPGYVEFLVKYKSRPELYWSEYVTEPLLKSYVEELKNWDDAGMN